MSSDSNCDTIILFIQRDIFNLNVILPVFESKTIFKALNCADLAESFSNGFFVSADLVAQEINVFRRTSLELFLGEEKCTSFQAEIIPILAHRDPVQHPLLDVSEQNLHIFGPGH